MSARTRMRLRRRKGWEARLAAAIETARGRPFEWGAHDCALFAADAALALTGEDAGAWFRGRYSTAAGAESQLRRFSVTDENVLEATLTKLAGAPVHPNMARRGDLVTVVTAAGPAVGVVGMDATLVHVVGTEGLVDLPRRLALKAWRIG